MTRATGTLLFVLVMGLVSGPMAIAKAAAFQVDMVDHTYIPRELNIVVGDAVTWTNKEAHSDEHTVTSKDDPRELDSEVLLPGESFTHVFARSGNFPYFCQIHPEMTGIVRVRPPGAPFAISDTLEATKDPTAPAPATGTVNVLKNDVDKEGDELTVTAFDEATEKGGTVACTEDGDCTYTNPEISCPSEDSFTYTISDGAGNTDSTTVKVKTTCESAQAGSANLSLALRKHIVAKGQLSSDIGACEDSRPVKIQRKTSGGWRTVGSSRTGGTGSYSIKVPDRPGTYRAKAPAATVPGGGSCSADASPTKRHSH